MCIVVFRIVLRILHDIQVPIIIGCSIKTLLWWLGNDSLIEPHKKRCWWKVSCLFPVKLTFERPLIRKIQVSILRHVSVIIYCIFKPSYLFYLKLRWRKLKLWYRYVWSKFNICFLPWIKYSFASKQRKFAQYICWKQFLRLSRDGKLVR